MTQRKTITRTATRVHISFGDNAIEWLFIRNPIDGRRVSANMIDHRRRAIIEYDESELRSGGLARGWADVVGFGVQPEAFDRLSPTGRTETWGGFTFSERRLPEGAEGGLVELWWSSEAGAPLRSSSQGERSELVVRSIRPTVNESLLLDSRRRFSAYSVMDVADFREQHHEAAKGDAHDR